MKLALDYQKGVISKITGILVCYRQMKSNVSILIKRRDTAPQLATVMR